MTLDRRDTDLGHLHPAFRRIVVRVLATLKQEQVPLALFEGFRSPTRQSYLFNRAPRITHNGPWKSFHQYGLAADFVIHVDGQWQWDDRGENGRIWQRLHDLAHDHGLQSHAFERPHLQLGGITIAQLEAGRYPAGGDVAWAENLEGAIINWTSTAAPPVPGVLPHRPAVYAAAAE